MSESDRSGVRSVFIEEAAQLLGVSRRTVYYRIREGRLRTIRTRGGTQRVLVESVEELLRSMRGFANGEANRKEGPLETEPLAL